MSVVLAGRVIATGVGGVYRVSLDTGEELDASLRGRLKQDRRTGNQVVIGDRVGVEAVADAWAIASVEARATELARRGRGGRNAKLLAANLTRVFAVVAARDPDATPELVDRLLVLVESSGMHPVLVINKTDLPGAREIVAALAPTYKSIGYEVLMVSAETGEGVAELEARMCDGLSALIGPSGVGKSTVLNAIDPGLQLRTGGLSRKTGTGRHTTVSSRLIRLDCGGWVADTPGFGDVGLFGIRPEEVGDFFPDFEAPATECRFRGCAHIHEPSCGVREAVAAGTVAASRLQSYEKMRTEAAEATDRW